MIEREAEARSYEESLSMKPNEQMQRQIFQLDNKRQELLKNTSKLQNILEEQRNKMDNTQVKYNKICSEKKSKSGQDSVKIPGLKHRLNLYKHIANIEWDTSQYDKIQGCM